MSRFLSAVRSKHRDIRPNDSAEGRHHGYPRPQRCRQTTLLETLATLRTPASGRVKILGLDLDSGAYREIRRRTGFLPQSIGFYSRFTALESVEYAAWLKGMKSSQAAEAAARALERVDLSDVFNKRMGALSGGTVRRVGIAQAIVHRPQLILLDEPSVGLDPGQRIGLRSLIRDLSAESSFIISTRLVDDLRSLADEVVVLSAGSVAFQGTTAELEAAAAVGAVGDSDLERGYSSVLSGRK